MFDKTERSPAEAKEWHDKRTRIGKPMPNIAPKYVNHEGTFQCSQVEQASHWYVHLSTTILCPY